MTSLDPAVLEDPLAANVVDSLRVLKAAIHQLSVAIAGDAALVPPPLQFRIARGESVDFSVHVSDMLSLGFDESGSVTRNPAGALVCSPACLEAARAVNIAKDQFATDCRAFLKSRLYATGREQLSKLFQSERMFTISLRQAYRPLIVCEKPVSNIGFALSRKGRSITIISPDQAISLLINRFGDEHAPRIEAIVNLFERSGASLYRIWENEARLTANLIFEQEENDATEEEKGKTKPKLIYAHSLILMPYGKTRVQCNVKSDRDWDILFSDRVRATRRDRRISNLPIIPKSNIYSDMIFDHLCVTVPFAEPKASSSNGEDE